MISGWNADGRTAVIAHRGGAGLGPENAIAVLGTAAASGADAVEVDVQELGDGSLILAHNASVTRRWRRFRLRDLTADQYARIVRLRPVEVSELIAHLAALSIGLYLDVKLVTPTGLRRLVDLVANSALADRTIVGSFRTEVVEAVATDRRLPASILYDDQSIDAVELARRLTCSYVHPCFDDQPWMVERLAGEWMTRVHERGLGVIGWNVNDAAILARMKGAGFDAICTDDPRLATL